MRVIKAKTGHYECPRGHRSDQCVELWGYAGRPDGIYCLPCLTLAIIDRLAVPKVELVVPAPRPEPEPELRQAETEEGAEGVPAEFEPEADLTGDPGVDMPLPDEQEEGDENAGGVPEDPDDTGGESAAD